MKSLDAINRLYALSQESRLAIFRLLVRKGPDGPNAGHIAQLFKLSPAPLLFFSPPLFWGGRICFFSLRTTPGAAAPCKGGASPQKTDKKEEDRYGQTFIFFFSFHT